MSCPSSIDWEKYEQRHKGNKKKETTEAEEEEADDDKTKEDVEERKEKEEIIPSITTELTTEREDSNNVLQGEQQNVEHEKQQGEKDEVERTNTATEESISSFGLSRELTMESHVMVLSFQEFERKLRERHTDIFDMLERYFKFVRPITVKFS
ncbi:hypothetical protein QOT17_014288 [Balamuthia mandrillaris]